MLVELEKEGNIIQNSKINQKEKIDCRYTGIGNDKSSFGIVSFEFSSLPMFV